MEIAREEVLLLDKDTEPALMKFYVSVEWLIKFLTFAEPGPINNRHFLCPHENADPGMFEQIGSRVCVVSEQTWHALHRRFGGGPAVTRIHPCTTCIREAKMLEERRSRERHMYRKLSELANEHELAPTFYISMSWFRKWQAFIDGTESVPPCQIDNREITKVKDGRVVLD
uniref:ubiquitinyl hydrolase 1 n=1 Tax=Ciona savignyi TaxID=51511 RepID=H2YH40_CIOSA